MDSYPPPFPEMPGTPVPSASPLTLATPIPSLLWESFEEVLRANMKHLVKDIAATLGQPEAPLLEAIRSKTIRPYLFEASAEEDKELDMRCQHLCQRPDAPAYLQPCGQPIVWHATPCTNGHRCAEHLYTAPVPRPAALPRRRPLQMDGVDEELRGPYTLYHTEDGAVLDGAGVYRGQYAVESKRLTLFHVMDETVPQGA